MAVDSTGNHSRMPSSAVKQKILPTDPPANGVSSGSLFLSLGPGLITGAADDDPSGIATYSQVGAQFGMGMLWTMLFSFPLMAAMQEICARLGRITGVGIAANLRKHYPRPILLGGVALLCVANVFNLGADIAAMGAAAQLIFGGNLNAYAVVFGVLSIFLQIYLPYRRYVSYLKWLTLALFAYASPGLRPVSQDRVRHARRNGFLKPNRLLHYPDNGGDHSLGGIYQCHPERRGRG